MPRSTHFQALRWGFVASVCLMVWRPGPAQAQSPWTIDVRGDLAIPARDLVEGTELNNSLGFDGSVAYRFMEHLSAYGGWGWHQFEATDSFAGPDARFEETGYALGLRWEHPFFGGSDGRLAYRVRAGATIGLIDVEDPEGELLSESGHGLGWEAGFGLSYLIGRTLRLSPDVRYRALDREVELGEETTDLSLRYVAVGVGLTWGL